jgi:hypothetical protein
MEAAAGTAAAGEENIETNQLATAIQNAANNAATGDFISAALKGTAAVACKTASDILHLAPLEAESIGHHRQTTSQLPVALPEMVSNLAHFKSGNRRIGDPVPRHPLPFLQLTYLAI